MTAVASGTHAPTAIVQAKNICCVEGIIEVILKPLNVESLYYLHYVGSYLILVVLLLYTFVAGYCDIDILTIKLKVVGPTDYCNKGFIDLLG